MTTPVLLLGDPRLRVPCAPVGPVPSAEFLEEVEGLKSALREFRAEHGFGRGIAAPQIGIPKRLIALNLGKGGFVIANPVITWRSEETFTLWDDCMSFPDLLCRVERHASISLSYLDETGISRTWDNLARAEAELLQHELDHLDGVLAVDRAMGPNGIVYRSVYRERKEEFDLLVG